MSDNLFLDADGTVLDFDGLARKVLGMSFSDYAAKFKMKAAWREIRHYRSPEGWGFYEALEFLPDAMTLIDAVKHRNPTILTGCPFGDWAPAQKVRCFERLMPGVPVITCMAKDKPLHMVKPGDVLIDDREQHREGWEAHGGIWITHTSAASSIAQLREIKPEWF